MGLGLVVLAGMGSWGMAGAMGGEAGGGWRGVVLRAVDEGEARFFVPSRWPEGPCRARGAMGSFGGELCPTGIRGWMEFRGRVPGGRFCLVRGGTFSQGRGGRGGEEGPGKGWAWREGKLVPRFRRLGGEGGLLWTGDLYRWGSGRWELCLELRRMAGGSEEGERGGKVRIPLPGRLPVSGLQPQGELAWKREGETLVLDLDPAGLREGDRCWVRFSLGMGDNFPSQRLLPLGVLGPPRRPGGGPRVVDAGMDLGALGFLLDRLLAATPADPRDRGDFLRVFPGGKRIWTHGEFDLPFALGRVARLLGRRDVLGLAQLSARHVFGRDLGDSAAGRSLLPAMHGPRHGGERVEPGHVFLRGALGLALCSGDRSFLAFLHRVGEALEGRVLSREWRPGALRDLAWPLLAFESAERVFGAEGRFGKGADQILRALDRAWDRRRGGFAFPESRDEEEGLAFRPLWIEAGLLVPGLLMAKARGRPLASSLLRRLKKDLHRLGLRRDPFARARAQGEGPWRKMGGTQAGRRDPLAEAWVLEGLGLLWSRRGRSGARRARACLKRVLQRFRAGSGRSQGSPGLTQRWDPATRLAIALQASWVEEALEWGLSESPGPRRGSPSPSGR